MDSREIQERLQAAIESHGLECPRLGEPAVLPVSKRHNRGARAKVRRLCRVPKHVNPRPVGQAIADILEVRGMNIGGWRSSRVDRLLVLNCDTGAIVPVFVTVLRTASTAPSFEHVYRTFRERTRDDGTVGHVVNSRGWL